jgi:hypothetical protein
MIDVIDLYPKYYTTYNFVYSSKQEKEFVLEYLNLAVAECNGKILALENHKKHSNIEIIVAFNYNEIGSVYKFIKNSQPYGKLYSVVAENINKKSYTTFPYIDMKYATSQDRVLYDHVVKLQRQKYILRLWLGIKC